MRKNISLYLVVLLLTACNNKNEVGKVVLTNPIIPENAINVSLRPIFGFNSVYGNINTTFTIYCDTLPQPTQMVARTSGNIFNLMCLESELLKPNTRYYWYCEAEKEGSVFPTDILSFTTVDTGILNGNHWHLQYVLKETDYVNKTAQDYGMYAFPRDSSFIYSEPYGFTISNDSVTNVYRAGVYGELPSQGTYSFSFDNVYILDYRYKFINLGINYYDPNPDDIFANKFILVLKQNYTDNVIVFKKSD